MKSIVSWFAKNQVASNLLMAFIVVAGLASIPSIKKEVFPTPPASMITVSVPYPGSTPEEVEEGICIKIEEEVQGLEGIKRLTSSSAEGAGAVTIQALEDYDIEKLLDDVKSRVDAIDTFPDEAEEPIVELQELKAQDINIAVSGDADEATLKRVGERIRDELAALPEITLTALAIARPYEVSVEVSEISMRRYGLTLDEVSQAIRQSSIDLPGGSIKTAGGDVLLRVNRQAYTRPEFEQLTVRANPDGSRLQLSDVANVVDGFAETDQSGKFDGQPAVVVQVFRVGNQSSLDIAAAVKKYVDEASPRMPEGIVLTVWQDQSAYLTSRLDLLMRNGQTGFILVFLILALFLQFKLAIWVSLGIPMSFLGTIWLMPELDVSISLISLFAFIVVLGIVVDDAIVVGENIYSHRKKSGGGVKGAIQGAQEVAIPVVFAVLTTVAAFYPLTSIPGNTGKIMRVIPLIVIPTILFSLVESLLILPCHLRNLKPHDETPKFFIARIWKNFQSKFANGLENFVHFYYKPALEIALGYRYATVALGVLIFCLTMGFVQGGWIKFNFFPAVESDNVAAMLVMPEGTSAQVTEKYVRKIESAAIELRDKLAEDNSKGEDLIRHMLASVGEQPYRTAQSMAAGRAKTSFSGGHLGEVHMEVAPSEDRDLTGQEIANMWREMVGPIPGAEEVTFTSSLFSPGEAINVQLAGNDIEQLGKASEALKLKLAEFPGVVEIKDSFQGGKRELKLKLLPEAEAYGLTTAMLARQVRQSFFGEEAQRIQRGREEIKVMVRFPEEERTTLNTLEEMRLRTPSGVEIPLSSVAVLEMDRGFSTIKRADRQRTINVTADVDSTKANANEITALLVNDVLPQILKDHDGVSYSFEGERREQGETIGGLIKGFILALFMIYALLAIPFKSYIQPVIVMCAIPFGIIGAILGHLVIGMDLTVLSVFGIVALTGVVVNDSLVMVDFVNRRREEHAEIHAAIREAGAARFRPILLTSLTTFAGLTPLLLEKSVQAKFLVPMAVSLGFGVIFATFVTLFLVPCGYFILEDIVSFVKGEKPHSSPV
jgi:multidrug efflux pump subunit AcrB